MAQAPRPIAIEFNRHAIAQKLTGWRHLGVQLYTVAGFKWDPRKAGANLRKHGIQFADAVPVLEDERAITLRDDVHAEEERWVTIGMDTLARVLTVVYTWHGNTVRIISARPATPNERKQYLENL